jgi:peptide/nickel transport system permease protein
MGRIARGIGAALSGVTARLAKAVAVILAIVVMNFFLIRLAPGDPALVIAGQSGATDAKFLEQVRRDFGLDRSLPEQLGVYMSGVLTLDLGFSHRQQQPVLKLLLDRLPATVLLTGAAFVFALGAGVLLGVLAATRVGTFADTAITVLALGAYATPIFWIGLMLILLFSVNLGWLPAFGMETIGGGLTGLARIADVAKHLILPALTLGLFYMALYARITRASMLEVGHQDFVKTARAKGLGPLRVTWVHILRNALLPVVTLAGVQAGYLIGGSILIETVFAWPGLGRLAFDAVLQRDYNLLLGVFLVTSIMVIAFNMATDAVYRLVDPRIAAHG